MHIRLLENFRAVFYTPFYASFALNAYEAEGLEVQRVMSPQPAETAQAVLDGKGDVAWGGPIRLLAGNNHVANYGLVLFCDVVGRDPFFVLGREPNAHFQFQDLLDKKIATVSEVPTPWLCLQHDIRLAGLDPDRIHRIAHRSMADNVAALGAGEVDVIQVFQPYVEQVLEQNFGHIWYAAAHRGATAYTAFYTTRTFLEQQPESLLRMTRAMYRTQRWIATHEAAELATKVAAYFPDVSHRTLTSALARYKTLGLWNHTPLLPRDGFVWLDAACLSGGFTQRSIPYERCVDMRFAEQVIREVPAELP